MIKEKLKIIYHVFTDSMDTHTKTLKEAREIIKAWKADGYTNLRIYKEWYTLEAWEFGEATREDCMYSLGDFPY